MVAVDVLPVYVPRRKGYPGSVPSLQLFQLFAMGYPKVNCSRAVHAPPGVAAEALVVRIPPISVLLLCAFLCRNAPSRDYDALQDKTNSPIPPVWPHFGGYPELIDDMGCHGCSYGPPALIV